jgi:hypothetical protein
MWKVEKGVVYDPALQLYMNNPLVRGGKLINRFALAPCPERETINQATLTTPHSSLTLYYN